MDWSELVPRQTQNQLCNEITWWKAGWSLIPRCKHTFLDMESPAFDQPFASKNRQRLAFENLLLWECNMITERWQLSIPKSTIFSMMVSWYVSWKYWLQSKLQGRFQDFLKFVKFISILTWNQERFQFMSSSFWILTKRFLQINIINSDR